jgi:hypothetical protein
MSNQKQIAEQEYNYEHFSADYYDFVDFTGLKKGDKFIDFELRTIDGKLAKISDYLDKPLVFEMGSITCPMYAGHVTPMQEISKKFPEYNFVVLYVREAHPGEKMECHTSIDQKIGNAIEASTFYKDNRTILVDDIDGKAHKVYGTLPNSIYVIEPNGTIVFVKAWNNTDYLEPILQHIKEGKSTDDLKFRPAKPGLHQSWVTLYQKGGKVSLKDFVGDLGALIKKHWEAGNLF